MKFFIFMLCFAVATSQTCSYLGEDHPINQEFISKDCLNCSCSSTSNSSLVCKPVCLEPLVTCEPNHKLVTTNEPVKKRPECMCKKYECEAPKTCSYLGEDHPINQKFISKDCLSCSCSSTSNSSIVCQPVCLEPLVTCMSNHKLVITNEPVKERPECMCKKYECEAPKKKPVKKTKRCFSATSFVRNTFGNKISMKDVKIGDKVLAVDSTGHPVYSEVIMMMHRNNNAFVDDFVKINTANNKSITLTKHHLIPTMKNLEFVYSKDVKVHQSLKVFDESSNTFEIVTVASIERVSGKGYYAPLTNHGTIVVDDVYASCYASFPFHYLSHLAFSFYRIMYPYLDVSSKQVNAVDEIHWYPDMVQTLVNGLNIWPNSV